MKGGCIALIGASQPLGARIEKGLLEAGADVVPVDDRTGARRVDVRHEPNGIVAIASGSPAAIRAQARVVTAVARALGPNVRLVHVGSMTVYGGREGVVDEAAPPPADLGPYAAAHLEAERTAREHPNHVILRPGCEYGPGCPTWSERIASLLRAGLLGDLGAAGDGICNLLFIDDLIDAIDRSLREPGAGGGTFNLAMRSPPTWNEYLVRYALTLRAVPARRIGARRLRLETRILAAPRRALEMATRRFGVLQNLAAPAVTASLIEACGRRITLDVTRAETHLGLRWTSLETGLSRTVTSS